MATTDTAAEAKMRAARARVSFLRPYFSHAIFGYVLVEAPRCPSIGVDEYMRMYWNPTFVHAHTIEQLAVILLHEIGHTLRLHHRRARALGVTSLTADTANICQDAEINDDLRDEIAARSDLPPLPGNPFLPASIGCNDYDVWEVYYAHLMDNAIVISTRGQGEPEDNDEGGSGPSNGNEGGKLVIRIPHDCGSGAHGSRRSWELGANSKTEGVSDADQRDIRRLTANAIADRQRSRGDVSNGWKEWADEILRPNRVPWDQELAGNLRWAVNEVAGKVFHSYKRPSRRQSAIPDIVMPDMRAPQPFVAIIGDTSGSMDTDDLALVRGTAQDICHSIGARVAFVATDATVHGGTQMVRGGRDIEMLGRGGTDMRVGIEYALSRIRPKPDVIVVCTDCETPWPAVRPLSRIIVCAINATETSIANIPSWARVIRIHEAALQTAVA
jgi:predicted metal-dependent peptidase